jgi:DNA (cytosine-5)-methyltransferase 1
MAYRFIDLFAGIGGFHLALHRLGAECVFASEIDAAARTTYRANHSKLSPALFEGELRPGDLFSGSRFNDDIRKVEPAAVPDHDILCAGFPCQPFSQAGHKLGFQDAANDRGNMFFILSRIIAAKRPRAIFLENVRHLVKHDDGATMKTIMRVLQDDLGYEVTPKIVKASDYGLPQHRPRIFLVGFRKVDRYDAPFAFPPPVPLKFTMSDVWNGHCDREVGFTLRVGGRSSNINDRRNWDHYRVNGEVRQLGPVEGAKMMGFPDDFEFPVPKTQAMKQLGNSVAVDAVQAVAARIIERLDSTTTPRIGADGERGGGRDEQG